MSFNYDFNKEDKKQQILKKLQALHLVENSFVKLEDICSILDRFCNKEFDREVIQQIYEKCEQDSYKQVDLSQFFDFYLEADRILLQKVQTVAQSTQDYNNQKLQCDQLLSQLIQQQVPKNQFGIDNDSQLFVECIQAVNLPMNQQLTEAPGVKLTVNQQVKTTQPYYSQNQQNPQWKQQFTFQIETGKEDLQIQITGVTSQKQTIILCSCGVSVQQLQDQQKQEQWLSLYDENHQELQAKVQMSLHWIHDKYKYYLELSKRFNEMISNLQIDQQDYQQDLLTIESIFSEANLNALFIQQQQLQLQQQQQYQMQEKNVILSNAQYQSPIQNSKIGQNNIVGMSVPLKNIVSPQQTSSLITTNNVDFDVSMLFICTGALVSLVLISSLSKTPFLDLIFVMMIFCIFLKNLLEQKYITILLIFCVITILYDILWLIMFSKGYWVNKNTKDQISNFEKIDRITVLFAWASLLTKFAIMFFLVLCRNKSICSKDMQLKILSETYKFGGAEAKNLFQEEQPKNPNQLDINANNYLQQQQPVQLNIK